MELDEILKQVQSGKISVSKAQNFLSLYSIEQIESFAKIDLDRKKRKGIPEVIFAETKQTSEIKKIIKKMLEKSNLVLVSRLKKSDYSKILTFIKKSGWKVNTGKNSSTILIYKKQFKKNKGKIGIVTAGTSDIGIAEEARLMAEAMNCSCFAIHDIGVAGIQRVFQNLKEIVKKDVDAIIVVAGMEGALATVVASLVDIPVIGLPSSVGYGYGEKGIAALASMLQSCSLGMSVVNIDNGIGAGAVAANIAVRANRNKN